MGIYIDVPDKRAWVKANAVPFHLDLHQLEPSEILVALAAGPPADGYVLAVMFSFAEFQRWAVGRPDAMFFVAPKAKVREVCPEAPI